MLVNAEMHTTTVRKKTGPKEVSQNNYMGILKLYFIRLQDINQNGNPNTRRINLESCTS